MRKWFTLEEAGEALRAKPLHTKMLENLKDRLIVLVQEQKETAMRRKAVVPSEEESRPEAEESFSALQGNGMVDDRAPIPLTTHHMNSHAHSLSTHSHQHQQPLPHHQHSQHSMLSQHQPHHVQHSLSQHSMQHPHSHAHLQHLTSGMLPSHVALPEITHMPLDDQPSHSGHTPLAHQPHPPHQPHPSHQPHPTHSPHSHQPYNAQGSKRKLDDLAKDTTVEGIPPPLGHAQ